MRSGNTPRKGRLLLGLLFSLLVGLLAAAGVAVTIGLAVTPSVDDLPQRVQVLLKAHHAVRVPLSQIPDQLSEALIATEDERFYQHHGIDFQGLGRALLADLYRQRALEGASTLSQQLVKNLYMGGNDDGWRKPQNLLMALKLEGRYRKHDILEYYFNTVYFGHGAWGIGQAAGVYFKMTPAELDLARSSMLAGLPQAPSHYDLYRNPCAARARQFAVLAQMVHDGYIKQEDATRAYAQPIGFPCK
jgi:membrane peptidoglycan carboxypeptidase